MFGGKVTNTVNTLFVRHVAFDADFFSTVPGIAKAAVNVNISDICTLSCIVMATFVHLIHILFI